MTKFKYLNEEEGNLSWENKHLKEIAYQLKRLTDLLHRAMPRIVNDGDFK